MSTAILAIPDFCSASGPSAPAVGRVGLFVTLCHVILRAPKKVLKMSKPILDISRDIHSLTTFRRRSGDFLRQLRKSKRPVVLTVKGKAAAVVQDAEAYQRLLDIAAQADAEEGIRQGLEDVARGRTRPARSAFDEVRRRNDIQR
jgi:prevent-host-death family protein